MASPGKHYREYGKHQQRPFQRAFHYATPQQEESEDESTDIDRAVSTLRITEILAHIAQILLLHLVKLTFGHHLLRVRKIGKIHHHKPSLLRLGRCATLDVGDKERECLGRLIAVLCDIVLVKTSRCRLAG